MPSRKCLFAVLAAITLLAATSLSAEAPIMQVRVFCDQPSDAARIHALGYDIGYVTDSYADVFTRREGLSELQQQGFRIEVIHEDVTAFYTSRLTDATPYGGFKILSEMYAYLDDMIADHSSIMTSRTSIGTSIEGRDIWAIKISDNPEIDEEEPELLFTACTHAREMITPEVLMYFMDHLTDNYGIDPEVTDIVDNREVWFIVMVNPDGYYYNEVIAPGGGGMWRKNRRDNLDGSFGVDLNRNYGYMWGYNDDGSSPITYAEDYRGTGPFSEPETQAIRDFSIARNFVIQIHYHSYSNYFLWPWRYNSFDTPDEDLFWILTDSMSAYNGYVGANDLMYSSNGHAADYGYGEQIVKDKSLSYTIEVGSYEDGFWPDPSRIDDLVAENLPVNLFLCRHADDVYSLAPPARPVISTPPGPQGPDYIVVWSDDDTEVAYHELIECTGMVDTTDFADNDANWYSADLSPTYYSPPYSFYMMYYPDLMWTKEPVYIDENDSLKFITYYNLVEHYSYLYVEVSSDGYNFQTIPGNLTTNDNPNGHNKGNGITGDAGGWIQAKFDLAAFAGQSLWLRFDFASVIPDPYNPEYSMAYIDDISGFKWFESETVIASDLTENFYEFIGQPDGEYYYRVRAQDIQGQWGKFSNYGPVTVEGGGPVWICGDADNDNDVDPMDAVFLVNWFWLGGPPPVYPEAVDVDGSGAVNPLDAVYFVDWLWRGGPDLNCP